MADRLRTHIEAEVRSELHESIHAEAEEMFEKRLASEQEESREGFSQSFGMGSQPSSQITDYPPVEELLAYMSSRREVFLEVLDGLDEESLARETPEGTPGFMPDYASVFETAVWHEALHSGQLSMIRRALGHQPIG